MEKKVMETLTRENFAEAIGCRVEDISMFQTSGGATEGAHGMVFVAWDSRWITMRTLRNIAKWADAPLDHVQIYTRNGGPQAGTNGRGNAAVSVSRASALRDMLAALVPDKAAALDSLLKEEE
jgi:hypothetical protein